tara:strand:- start:81 stop:446 length:366 start_codon:yes stop_codon:yes gene_type:complete
MYQKITIRKAMDPELKKLMGIANDMEKNLKAIKKMVQDGQQQQEWEWQYYRWRQHEEGPVLDSNPLFDDEDREKWALMMGKRKKQKPSEKIKQSGPTDPKELALYQLMQQGPDLPGQASLT